MRININLGLLEQNNYFGDSLYAHNIADQWADAMRLFGVMDNIDVMTTLSGINVHDAESGSAEDTWFDTRSREALANIMDYS